MPYSIGVSAHSLCANAQSFPQRALERRVGFLVPSSPEDAYLRDDQDDAEQLTGLGSGSPRYSPSFRHTEFSETGGCQWVFVAQSEFPSPCLLGCSVGVTS